MLLNGSVVDSLQVTKKPPRTLQRFQAHDSLIVSVEMVEHESDRFVLTASTDCTVRLFAAASGASVGIFGQVNFEQ